MALKGLKRAASKQSSGEGSPKNGLHGILSKGWLAASMLIVGFLAILTFRLTPSEPESRLPASQRLPALIARQQDEIKAQRAEVQQVRSQVEETRSSTDNAAFGLVAQKQAITEAERQAGLSRMRGPGFMVTLNDSTLNESPSGNVNDLVIHSQDVQGVVNALWSSGAEAISINGERVVSTSAILCVGNTLLLNGTVHAPPYEVTSIGASRGRFNEEPAVKRLNGIAQEFSLRFGVGRQTTVSVPAYDGALNFRYAYPTSAVR